MTMTHTYHISGMTCSSCRQKVQEALQQIDGITQVDIDLETGKTQISMSRHISTGTLQQALKPYPKYRLSEAMEIIPHIESEEEKSWWQTYKPVLLIFMFITGLSLIIQLQNGRFLPMQWMNHFMAGFFLVFSFFKWLNLQGFADSYATYDIIAKRWRPYGFIYAFIELALGIAYFTGLFPLVTNMVAFVVMSISLVGVLQSVLNKRKIKCACLGDVFNLPMSTITIIEDAAMILMSGLMLLLMFL